MTGAQRTADRRSTEAPSGRPGGPSHLGDDLPTALAVDRVSRRFPDGTDALDQVSLDVKQGEFVAVVGPSGCGKSTLLRIIAGLDTPTHGTITRSITNLGYVFQDATLLPWRTVRENVELLGELHGVDRERRRQAAVDAIALTGLTGFEDHLPRQLSGGMRMRVSLARSLTTRPTLFLFDEPFGALDELTRIRLNEELGDLQRREGFAALFVTHSVSEAVFLSQRVLVMSARPGRFIAEIAVPFEPKRPPELRFDAAFGRVAGDVAAALREPAA